MATGHVSENALFPFSDPNDSKTIPFGAAHTYIAYIGEYPPGGGGLLTKRSIRLYGNHCTGSFQTQMFAFLCFA